MSTDELIERALSDLTSAAPPPPALAGIEDRRTVYQQRQRRNRNRRAGAAATAVAGLAVLTGAVLVADDPPTTVASGQGGDTAATVTSVPPDIEEYRCGDRFPVEVTIPGAIRGPSTGPAPGSPPVERGQLVMHWQRADDYLEVRWPAPAPPLYDLEGTQLPPFEDFGFSSRSDGGAELSISTEPPSGSARAGMVIAKPAAQSAPCDSLQVIGLAEGRRAQVGLRVTDEGVQHLDLQPLVIERRSVHQAPTAPVGCQGSESPNVTGDRPDISSPEPAEALRAFLATPAAQTLIKSGYVEMTEPDGSITFGVDPGPGWVTLITVVQTSTGWAVESWAASGC